ncbi:uncharacterized protein LOC111495615 isoform X2 [Cucurbita maxima]|uniref:Uncharacterized protein LOC111495615 isoform X2 n=1 Tax=Cucurbita maxima TaxID=3661 RepID=A0A6J1KIS6_CUCMA|nr:uncharacterized protein LOC111495615 isoform X2 [Cucurbita maxima]
MAFPPPITILACMPDIWDTQEMMMSMDFLFLNFAIRVMRSSHSEVKPESNDEQENNQKKLWPKKCSCCKRKASPRESIQMMKLKKGNLDPTFLI